MERKNQSAIRWQCMEEQMVALSGQIENLTNQLDNMGGSNSRCHQPTPHFVDEDDIVIFSRARSE